MGKTLDVVKAYYDAFDQHAKDWKELVADNISFEGPLQRASDKKEFVALTEQFLRFHKKTRLLKQFEDADQVCSIYEFIVQTPADKTLSCSVAEWVKVSNGKIAEIRIYYDPREFAKAFGMQT
jgi:ketosteroid isomerase-like protein